MPKTSDLERARKRRWREKNKERIREYNSDYNKLYRESHPRQMKEYRKRYYLKRKAFLRSLKENVPCAHCGNSYPPVAMDWHHLDPKEKDFSISRLWNQAEDKLKAEIEKCILLCAVCHRIHHFPEGA